MFVSRKLLFVFLVALFCTIASVANGAEIYELGPYQACAFGGTEAIAQAKAQDRVEEFLDDLQDMLPAGHFIMTVGIQGSWDGVKYTYTFTVWVFGC